MSDSLVVILIISHKTILDEYELISLRQCYNILGRYPIRILCPNNIDLSFYENNLPNPKFDCLDPKWQSSYEMFNKLKLSTFLYKKYSNYEYILFYEPDAFVFRDELEYWCKKGYDYIGAPWFEGWHEASPKASIIGVGNGGFSLRRTRSIIKLLKIRDFYSYADSILNSFKIKSVCRKLGIMKKSINHFSDFIPNVVNEDYYIFLFSAYFKWYRKAPYNEAICFSFDVNPKVLFKMNKGKLPFGCHAWRRYNPDFWMQFICE